MTDIVTFYSQDEGAGRSVLLAKVAWVLALRGKRVLVVDWDLDAPALHTYFRQLLPDALLRHSPGLIDMVWTFSTSALNPFGGEEPGWHEELADIRRYATSVEYAFPGSGTIDLVPAGRQDRMYRLRVESFDWSNFYGRLGGGPYVESLKRSMRASYDYTLVNSSTGQAETAGVCAVQVPDILVTCFSESPEAVDGAVEVAASVGRQRGSGVRILPVMLRGAGGVRRLGAGEYARSRLEPFVAQFADGSGYWKAAVHSTEDYLEKVDLAGAHDLGRHPALVRVRPFVDVLTRTVSDHGTEVNEPVAAAMAGAGHEVVSTPTTPASRAELGAARGRPRLDARSTYFYLSYAHAPAPPNHTSTETNYWVRTFFEDLSAAVQQRAHSTAQVGFYDALLPPDADPAELVRGRLESVEVFVPLYSPNYFSRSWSKRQWDAFQSRLGSSGTKRSEAHICPVLWTPMPSVERIPHIRAALALGEGIDAYAEDGVEAMLRLRDCQAAYREVLARLAAEIVRVAEYETLGPSAVSMPPEATETIHLGASFTVAVAALATGGLPRERRGDPYGETGVHWRPFCTSPATPIAETAIRIVELLNLDATAVELRPDASLFARSPGVLIVDPWCLAVDERRHELTEAIRHLPAWVSVVAVVDRDDPQFNSGGRDLADRLFKLAADAGRPFSVVYDLEAFVKATTEFIVQAHAIYLRHGPAFPPSGPHAPLPKAYSTTRANLPTILTENGNR